MFSYPSNASQEPSIGSPETSETKSLPLVNIIFNEETVLGKNLDSRSVTIDFKDEIIIDEKSNEILMLNGIINFDNYKLHFTSQGYLEIIGYNSYDVISIPLWGEINIFGTVIPITVGYESYDNKVALSITFETEDFCVLVFGERIISPEINRFLDELKENTLIKEELPFEDSKNILSSTRTVWKYLNGKTGYSMYGKSSIPVVGAKLYKTTSEKELRFDTLSYTTRISSALKKTNPYHKKVSLDSIKTSVELYAGRCFGTSPTSNESGNHVFWREVFFDILSAKGLPTGVLNYIFQTKQGGIFVNEDIMRPSIELKSGYSYSFNCDQKYLNLFYGIYPNDSNRVSGKAHAAATYKITDYYPSPDLGEMSYYKTERCSINFSTPW